VFSAQHASLPFQGLHIESFSITMAAQRVLDGREVVEGPECVRMIVSHEAAGRVEDFDCDGFGFSIPALSVVEVL
jgi:hypothetical protein